MRFVSPFRSRHSHCLSYRWHSTRRFGALRETDLSSFRKGIMKVIIISTNQSVFPMPVMPIGACMVAEAVARAGHKVVVLDLMFERAPERVIASALRK